jgi:genome maintenance exonuclease 1
MFVHLDYFKTPIDIKSEPINGIRFYRVPSGNLYPSVTSVTGIRGKEKIIEWREKVGEEEADRIIKIATGKGNIFHKMNEIYLLNGDVNELKPNILSKFYFNSAKPYLDRINNIHALEKSLYSDYLKIAGTVDCIAEYEGELAVIDFKTSKKIKPEKWIENYFVQETAYACMYYEMTGIPVKKLITIMVDDYGECFVYEKRNKGNYIKLLTEYIREFNAHHNAGTYAE